MKEEMRAKLENKIKKINDDEIILVCSKENCPRTVVREKAEYDPKEAVILISACEWHEAHGGFDDLVYLDKNFKEIFE